MKKVLTFFLAFAMAGGCLAQSAPSCEMTIDTLSGCAPFAVEFKFKSVNTDTLAKGVYFLKIETDRATVVRKIVVE